MKPLTTWFNHFLLIEYDDCKWIEHFSISKDNFLDIYVTR
jgi:hypothetical protein